ncbi:MAG: hypothetical protein OEM52_12310 [bacterium]|nr:hypothetical protein [bacterium]
MNEPPLGVVVTRNEWGAAIVEEVTATCFIDCALFAMQVNPDTPDITRPSTLPGQCIVWFVDAPCSSAERAVQRCMNPEDHIFTGFSLPVLLSFATKRKLLPLQELLAACESAHLRGLSLS